MVVKFIFYFSSFVLLFLSISCNEPQSKEKISNNNMEIDTMLIDQFIFNLKSDFLISYDSLPHRSLKKTTNSYYKRTLIESNETNNTLSIYFIDYKTKQQFEKGLNLFLRNIGDLETVIWEKDMKHVKSPPIFAIFNSKSILFLEYKCENSLEKEVIDDILKNLLKFFLKEDGITMDIKCGGPLKWNQ